MATQPTSISANDGKEFSHIKSSNATSGMKNHLGITDFKARISTSQASMLTPSYAPITGDDLWRGDFNLGWNNMPINEKRNQISEEDMNNLIQFKLQEEALIKDGELPDAKMPYLLLQKPSQMQLQQEFIEHARLRRFYSTVNEADSSVS